MKKVIYLASLILLFSSCAPECVKEADAKYIGKYWDDNVALQEEIYLKYGGMLPDKEWSLPELGIYYYDFIKVPMTMELFPDENGRRFIMDFKRGGAKNNSRSRSFNEQDLQKMLERKVSKSSNDWPSPEQLKKDEIINSSKDSL
jgi:hypothetical protein